MEKTYILLDIDGVISPKITKYNKKEMVIINNLIFKWKIYNNVSCWLKQTTKNSEVIWASMWGKRSNLINKKLEIPELEYITFQKKLNFNNTKLPKIQKIVEKLPKKSNILWLDDNITKEAMDLGKSKENLHVYKINKHSGITKRTMKEIQKYL